MANEKDQQLDIERARELLSPYLDDEVTEAERALVEEAITTSAELRQEMEMLRQTVSLVSRLPQMPAPRPFTISEVDIKGAAPAERQGFTFPFWLKSWATLAATLVCVIALGAFLLLRFGLNGFSPAAPAEIAMEDSAPAQPTATPVEVEQPESEALREEAAAEEIPAEETVEEEAMMAESAAEEEAAPPEAPPEAETALEAAPAEEEAAEPSPEEAPAPSVAEEEAGAAVAEEERAEEEPAAMAAEAAPAEESQTEANGGAARAGAAQSGEADLALTATPSPVAQATEIEAEGEQTTDAIESEPAADQDDAALQQKSEPAAEETDSATSTATSPPSPTATVESTRVSAATPAVEATSQAAAAPEEGTSQRMPLSLVLLAGIILLVGLIVVGIIAWLVVLARRQKG